MNRQQIGQDANRGGIFISYRREDSAGHTGRLMDRLTAQFGHHLLFRDIDTLRPGEDFIEAIHDAIAACEVFVTVIGKHWLTSVDATGKRRLDNPEDYVRLEIAAALGKNIKVIPVLVQGAAMPATSDLPDDVKKLTRLNAIDISDGRWDYDVGVLIKVLEEIVHIPATGSQLKGGGPKLGLLSADTCATLVTILRNMLLNWLVLLPLLMAFLALPYLIVSIVRLNSSSVSSFGFRLNPADLLLIGGCVLATIALAYMHSYRPSLQERTSEKWKAWGNQNTFLFMSLLPLIVSAGLITTWWAWVANDGRGKNVLNIYPWGVRLPGLLFMLVAGGVHLAGWLLSVVALRRWNQFQGTIQEAGWIVGELVVIILSGALGGYLAWMAPQILPDGPVNNFAEYYGAFAIPVFLSVFVLAAALFVGLSGRFTDDEDRKWWARSGGWALMVSIVWGIIAALALFVANWVSTFHALLGMISSGIVVTWLCFSSKSAANTKEEAQGDWNRLPDIVLLLAAPVFAGLLIIVLSWTTGELFRLVSLHVFGDAPMDSYYILDTTHVGRIALIAIVFALVSALFAWAKPGPSGLKKRNP